MFQKDGPTFEAESIQIWSIYLNHPVVGEPDQLVPSCSLPRSIIPEIGTGQKPSEEFVEEQLTVDNNLIAKEQKEHQVLCHWCIHFVFDKFSWT